MAADMDAETAALVQAIMAADHDIPPAEDFAQEEPSDGDEDYGSKPSKRRKAAGPRGKKAAAAPVAAAPTPDAGPTEEGAEPRRKRRKDAGSKKEGEGPRSWTPEEERLFLEALDKHGRDWRACAAHVGTRSVANFKSHAQKHFVTLVKTGQLLPPKVAETGLGYTLSGKPLDPRSASAVSYGLKEGLLRGLADCVKPGLLPGFDSEWAAEGEGQAGATGASEPAPDPGKENLSREGNGVPAVPAEPLSKPKARKSAAKSEKAAADGAAGSVPEPAKAAKAAEPTAYAQARPKRARAAAQQGPQWAEATTEDTDLTDMVEYQGVPGGLGPRCQPYSVHVSQAAHLLMDLHAHLSGTEVIGLLGGHYDEAAKRLSVAAAFPCARAPGSLSSTSVELDPAAEVATRALMDARGLTAVGWYHSHPTFAARPSRKDNENQRNYQALFHVASGAAPFVAAIVAPYDLHLPGPASALTYFLVELSSAGGLVPMRVAIEVEPRAELPGAQEEADLEAVIEGVAGEASRLDLGALWRQFGRIEGGVPTGQGFTRVQKLREALQAHFPASLSLPAEALLDKLCALAHPHAS